MTTQAQTLRQRFEALAQWEQGCPGCTGPGATSSAPPVPCHICHDTGKAPVLPGLRKPCPCTTIIGTDSFSHWSDLGGCRRCWIISSGGRDDTHDKKCACMSTAIPGWVLRGDPETEDGRLMLTGVLLQYVMGDGSVVRFSTIGGLIGCQVRWRHASFGEGLTVLEALVDVAMQLKEAQP